MGYTPRRYVCKQVILLIAMQQTTPKINGIKTTTITYFVEKSVVWKMSSLFNGPLWGRAQLR